MNTDSLQFLKSYTDTINKLDCKLDKLQLALSLAGDNSELRNRALNMIEFKQKERSQINRIRLFLMDEVEQLLSDKYKRVFLLRCSGKSFKEISSIMNYSESYCRKLLQSAEQMLSGEQVDNHPTFFCTTLAYTASRLRRIHIKRYSIKQYLASHTNKKKPKRKRKQP